MFCSSRWTADTYTFRCYVFVLACCNSEDVLLMLEFERVFNVSPENEVLFMRTSKGDFDVSSKRSRHIAGWLRFFWKRRRSHRLILLVFWYFEFTVV